MSDAVTLTFKKHFDTVYTVLEQAVELCPEALWTEKVGGFYFWQQIVHVFGIIDLVCAETADAPLSQNTYSSDIIRLLQDGETTPAKGDVLSFAAQMKKIAQAYFARMTDDKLLTRNEYRTLRLGTEASQLDAMITLVGHGQYHVGICGAYFRDRGIKGIY
ncbi:MAG: hypothetical protein LBV76_05065 [Deltaproteobacteria bacterium]|jgi:hypothetical protein|nr:hypothetical protein [Deltaproteobacteria bacterium]